MPASCLLISKTKRCIQSQDFNRCRIWLFYFKYLSGSVWEEGKETRIKWTEEMNAALLQCKEKAVKLTKGDNPPRNGNGRKIGYMQLMKDMWDK